MNAVWRDSLWQFSYIETDISNVRVYCVVIYFLVCYLTVAQNKSVVEWVQNIVVTTMFLHCKSWLNSVIDQLCIHIESTDSMVVCDISFIHI